MPIYEYQCQSCDRRSETLQRMNDPPLTTCEVCGGPLRKLISAPAVQFKGSGWYVTDYARKGGEGKSKEDKGAGGGDSGGGDSGGGDSGGGESGSGKESGGKDAGGKESGAKQESGSAKKESSGSGDSGKGSTSGKTASDS